MNETRQQKLEYLTDNGYLHNLRGELGMSTKTLSLLTKLPEDMFTAIIPKDAKNGDTGNAILSEDLVKAMRRGSIEHKNRQIAEKDAQIKVLEPKALFADAVAASDGTCLVGELAKMLRQNGLNIGQNRLFQLLRDDGFFGKSGSNRNVPTQKAMDLGLFRIKETAVTHSDGHVTISRTPKVTGKGQRYFIARYCPEKKPND